MAAEQHNRKAFNELVVRYQSPIRRFFLNQTLGNEALSDDLAQVSRRNAENSDTTVSLDIYAALNTLNNYERTCLTLQLMEGQPIDKIAEIMGMAAGTVKSHLFRGKDKMTRYLKENGYDRKR